MWQRAGRKENRSVSVQSVHFNSPRGGICPGIVGGAKHDYNVGASEIIHAGDEGTVGEISAFITGVADCSPGERVVFLQSVTAVGNKPVPPCLPDMVNVCQG